MKKTKIMVCGPNLNTLNDFGLYPCGVCPNGAGRDSIYCSGCSHWIHKRGTNITGVFKANEDFRCKRCLGAARPIDGRPYDHLNINDEELQVVDSFCCLNDMVSDGGRCESAIITRARGKFRELLSIYHSNCKIKQKSLIISLISYWHNAPIGCICVTQRLYF